MQLIAKLLISACLLLPLFSEAKESVAGAITQEVQGQSFGRNMLAYIHAKWQAHVNEIPFLLRPFPYANQMELYKEETKLGTRRFSKNKTIRDENEIIYMNPERILYTIPYFPEVDPEMVKVFPPPPYFTVLWEDKKFAKEIRKMCKPTSDRHAISLPKGRISIALHVRTGLPGESQEKIAANPTHFPPNSYYIAQLHKLNEIFKESPLYVYVFTDHKYPEKVTKALERELNLTNVIFDSREGLNNTRAHVVEDFYNMTRFHCLVRPESNLSLVAELLGNHSIVIKPNGRKVHIKVREK